MALTRFGGDVNVISKLENTPMLEAQKLKESFDAAGQALKEYLNDTLIPDLDNKFRDIDDQLEKIPDIVDSLESDDTKAALSAAQGKELAARAEQARGLAEQGKTLAEQSKSLAEQKQDRISMGTSAPSGGYDGQIYIWY